MTKQHDAPQRLRQGWFELRGQTYIALDDGDGDYCHIWPTLDHRSGINKDDRDRFGIKITWHAEPLIEIKPGQRWRENKARRCVYTVVQSRASMESWGTLWGIMTEQHYVAFRCSSNFVEYSELQSWLNKNAELITKGGDA